MSSRQQVQKAMRRAKARDRKRQTKMKVSGKSVFNLQRTIDKPRGK